MISGIVVQEKNSKQVAMQFLQQHLGLAIIEGNILQEQCIGGCKSFDFEEELEKVRCVLEKSLVHTC